MNNTTMAPAATMSKGERNDLASLVRKRERVMKAAAKRRSTELMADFQHRLGQIYSCDQDETWKAAAEAAEEAVNAAQAEVAKRCEELGIPREFAPQLNVFWHNRGENAVRDRRVELERSAKTRIAAIEADAIAKIELYSLDVQTKLIADGLTSEAAQEFLTGMPSVESLMTPMSGDEVQMLVLTRPDRPRYR